MMLFCRAETTTGKFGEGRLLIEMNEDDLTRALFRLYHEIESGLSTGHVQRIQIEETVAI